MSCFLEVDKKWGMYGRDTGHLVSGYVIVAAHIGISTTIYGITPDYILS